MATSSQSYKYTQLGFSPNRNCFCTKQTNLMASLCCMRRNWENHRIHPRNDSPFQDSLLASNLWTICTEILNVACTVTTACFSLCLRGSGRGLPGLAPPPTSTPASDLLINPAHLPSIQLIHLQFKRQGSFTTSCQIAVQVRPSLCV